MKVKIFCDSNNDALEKAINKFIETHEVIDIKFASTHNSFDIMILYKE